MPQYAKIISQDKIELAPQNKGSVINYNLNTTLLKIDGYKLLHSAELPNSERLYKLKYSQDENNIYETVNYLETEENYNTRKSKEENLLEINSLIKQIQEYDTKRLRAVCEPSVKDEITGETWLEYYNAKILELRNQIKDLKERITTNDLIE